MNQNRLKWACRRGMLELDLVLMDFLHKCYSSLTSHQQKSFAQLLECTDAELADWLLSKKNSPDNLHEIIKMIQSHANRII
jgi:antitoxin CptB